MFRIQGLPWVTLSLIVRFAFCGEVSRRLGTLNPRGFGAGRLNGSPVLEWPRGLLASWPSGLSTVDCAGGKRSSKKKTQHPKPYFRM